MIDGLEIVRHPRARRTRLSFDPRTGRVRLTLPRRAALAPALAWAGERTQWIEQQRRAVPAARPFADGAVLPVADETLTICCKPGRGRAVQRDGAYLIITGPSETVSRRVEGWLRHVALDLLSSDTATFAMRAGVTVAQVSVGDARRRWGSCGANGRIRYNWRLVLAPGWVRRAIVAHEVAHRVHMNHGSAFHAFVADLLGDDAAPAHAWLREHGTGLYWFGVLPED